MATAEKSFFNNQGKSNQSNQKTRKMKAATSGVVQRLYTTVHNDAEPIRTLTFPVGWIYNSVDISPPSVKMGELKH